MIQPATEPLFESYPPRKKWTAITLVGLVFLGFSGVVVVGIISALRRDLKSYAEKLIPESAESSSNPQREEWIDE
jgi:uncharacterized protein involved in exopolysaccharide biosynthesis